MKRKLKGFTLVELVITIAIVIILSVISVPIYRGYVTKAMYSEGYALLGTILSAQKAYYSEYGNFLSGSNGYNATTSFEPTLNIDARGNKYFSKFHTGTNTGNCKFYFHAGLFKPEELIKAGKGKLFIQYNITKGAKFVEGEDSNGSLDSSWYSAS